MNVNPRHFELLWDPTRGKLRTWVAASGSGTNFREVVRESEESEGFLVDLLVTDRPWKDRRTRMENIGAVEIAEQKGISTLVRDGYAACGSRRAAMKDGPREMHAYQQRVLKFNAELYCDISDFANVHGFQFGLGILAGYMRIVDGNLLRGFWGKMVNVHPARLDVLNQDGTRKYTGDRAVSAALNDRQNETASSVILVDNGVDTGPILATGPRVTYDGGDYEAHQDKQKEKSDWPTLRFVMREIARGELGLHKHERHLDGNPIVVYRGEMMSYKGIDLEEL